MSDYISREETLKRLCKDVCNVSDCQCDEIRCEEWFVIHNIPAADVRPVVLCRDCLHYEMGVCLKIYDDGAANKDAWQERKPEDFCSYGEKREES